MKRRSFIFGSLVATTFGSAIFCIVRDSENVKDWDFDQDGWYVSSVEAEGLMRLGTGNGI